MKKKIAKLLSLFLLLIFFTPVNTVKAENMGSKITYFIEQPAIYSAAPGDKLNYVLNVKLPAKASAVAASVKSFTVTVRIDKDLHVEGAKIRDIKPVEGKIGLSIFNTSDAVNNTVSFIVKDVKSLGDRQDIKVDIATIARSGMKGDTFSNSAAYTYESIDGKDLSNGQKDIITSTKKDNGVLNVTNEIYNSTKEIKGQTEKNAIVKIYLQDKEIASGISDANGNYSIKIQPLEEGTHLKVVSYFKDAKNTKIADRDVEVTKDLELEKQKKLEEQKKIEEQKKLEEQKLQAEKEKKAQKYNDQVLADYLNMAKNINLKNVNNENTLRMEAAIAQAKYIQYKSKVEVTDFESAINEILGAVKAIRTPYMNGYSDDKFGPNDKMTRAQVSAVIARILNGKDPKGDFSSFKDVDQEKWYSDAIAFMEKQEIINGYSDGTFKPEKEITRAEFASIISKLINDRDFDLDNAIKFKDVKSDNWAMSQIDMVTAKGLMNGRTKDTFAPNAPITRAEVATVLNKFLGRNVNEEFMRKYSVNPFKDLSKDFWAYAQILEATGNYN